MASSSASAREADCLAISVLDLVAGPGLPHLAWVCRISHGVRVHSLRPTVMGWDRDKICMSCYVGDLFSNSMNLKQDKTKNIKR